MKASKKEYLKHVMGHLALAYLTKNSEYISVYSLELDNIIDNQLTFNEHE